MKKLNSIQVMLALATCAAISGYSAAAISPSSAELQNLDNQVTRREWRFASDGYNTTCEAPFFSSGGHGARTRNPLRGTTFPGRIWVIRCCPLMS